MATNAAALLDYEYSVPAFASLFCSRTRALTAVPTTVAGEQQLALAGQALLSCAGIHRTMSLEQSSTLVDMQCKFLQMLAEFLFMFDGRSFWEDGTANLDGTNNQIAAAVRTVLGPSQIRFELLRLNAFASWLSADIEPAVVAEFPVQFAACVAVAALPDADIDPPFASALRMAEYALGDGAPIMCLYRAVSLAREQLSVHAAL
jgi:hypothetical protein